MKSAYRIRIKGMINFSAIDWFGGLSSLPTEKDETVLVGEFADQAALRGLLEQLWNLNYTLLSVEQIEKR